MLCGIDEAGRGPVIGPMLIAGVVVEDDRPLKELGVKDSKQLSRSQRERLYPKIINIVQGYYRHPIQPVFIDKAVNSALNLNGLEALVSAIIIEKISPSPDVIILDCPSNNIPDYVSKVKQFLLKDGFICPLEIRAEHKADVNHAVVSAASIIAKVERDWAVDKIKSEYHIDCGSGYPSDPKTKIFLKENYNKNIYNHIIRHSWQVKL